MKATGQNRLPSESVAVEWDEPAELRHWLWRARYLPIARRMLAVCLSASAATAVVVGLLTYFGPLPGEFLPRALAALTVLSLLFPSALLLGFYLTGLTPARFRVTDAGVRTPRGFVPGREVDSFDVGDVADLPSVVSIDIRDRRGRTVRLYADSERADLDRIVRLLTTMKGNSE